jgi:transposase
LNIDLTCTETDATKLLGLEGMGVIKVEVAEAGTIVQVATTDPAARGCPTCGVEATVRKDRRITRPRHLPYGGRTVDIRWHKQRWPRSFTCARQREVIGWGW